MTYKSLAIEFKIFNDKLMNRLDEIEESHKHEIREYNTLVRRLSNRLEELQKDNAKLKNIIANRTAYEGLLK